MPVSRKEESDAEKGKGYALRLLSIPRAQWDVRSGGHVQTWPQTELGLDPSASSTPVL